jgi:hypothetical protein
MQLMLLQKLMMKLPLFNGNRDKRPNANKDVS